jgi:hypothetical protein
MKRVREFDEFRIVVVDNQYVREEKDEITAAMSEAFQGATFIDPDYTPTTPVEKTYEVVEDLEDKWHMAHVLGRDALSDRLIGGMFCVPTRPSSSTEKETGIGWIFMSREVRNRVVRHKLIHAMADMAINILIDAGYDRLVTQMGTEVGAATLQEPLGVTHEPLPSSENRWVRSL